MMRNLTSSLACVVLGVTGAVQAQVAPLSAADWSKQVWSVVQSGSESKFHTTLDRLPEDGELSLTWLRQSIDLLSDNVRKRESARLERLEELSAEIDKHLQGERTDAALSAALKAAVDYDLVLADPAALKRDPRIAELERAAAAAANRAETRGDWLMASELFSRLNILHEKERTYRADLERQVQRLAMIRLYAPQRLWEMRNNRRLAEGERPLPPYNPVADTYQEKLKGLEQRLVEDAVFRSARFNVRGANMGDMLRGAIESLRTFATTPEIHEVFPGLKDAAGRQGFLAVLDREQARVNQLGQMADQQDVRIALGAIRSANRETVRIPDEAILHEFGNGAMAALDEFSAIIWPDELRRFERSTQGRFVGVGVQIKHDDLFNIEVVTPLEGQPAQRAGIRAGDIITRVNDISAIGLSLDQAVEVITGPANTEVSLTVQRSHPDGTSEEKTFTVRRKEIELRSVKGWRRLDANEDNWDWFIDPDNRIGYLRMTQFHESTTAEFDRAIAQMRAQGLQSLILDLRFNPGGLLDQAVSVASRFVDGRRAGQFDGLIVSTEDRTGRRAEAQRAQSGQARLADIPVVVLVNESSASASEIVSGAIRDYSKAGAIRGTLIGQRTFGKGSVQNVWYLEGRRAALKLTTQYYRLPGGDFIHNEGRQDYGVPPNMLVNMIPAQIVEALKLRQDADVVPLDDQGKPVAMEQVPDPSSLINDGLDLQLQSALVLLQTQAKPVQTQRAVLRDAPPVRTP